MRYIHPTWFSRSSTLRSVFISMINMPCSVNYARKCILYGFPCKIHHSSPNPTLAAIDSGGIRRFVMRKIHLTWNTKQNSCHHYSHNVTYHQYSHNVYYISIFSLNVTYQYSHQMLLDLLLHIISFLNKITTYNIKEKQRVVKVWIFSWWS